MVVNPSAYIFLPILNRVMSLCCKLRCCGTSFLMSNDFSLKNEIRLFVSYSIVAEACEKSWYLFWSLLISYSTLICCRKGFIKIMS